MTYNSIPRLRVGPALTISSRRELFRQAGRDAEDRAENIQPMQLLKMIIPSTVAVWPPSLSAQLGSWAAAALAAIRPAVTSAACSLTASLATWHGTFQAIRPCPSTSLAPLHNPTKRSDHKIGRWLGGALACSLGIALSRNLCHTWRESPSLSRHKHHIFVA